MGLESQAVSALVTKHFVTIFSKTCNNDGQNIYITKLLTDWLLKSMSCLQFVSFCFQKACFENANIQIYLGKS